MVVTSVFNIIFYFLTAVFALLPTIPAMTGLVESLDVVFDILIQGINLLFIFIRPTTILAIIPIMLTVMVFIETYELTMWILKKIPILGIK